jgi:TonB family protein
MMELSQKRTMTAPAARYSAQNHQPRKLMIALVLLLVALVAVLVKDRQFWFGSEQAVVDSDLPVSMPASVPMRAESSPALSAPAHATKNPVASTNTSSQPAPEQPAVTANRTVLPPLDVEVVAGSNHHPARPANNVTKLEITKAPSIEPEEPASTLTMPAAEHEPVPVAATHLPQAQMQATYPVLAQHMNVQGSVVLEAVINADGTIQNLRVLSGAPILSTAAQQAVREWRFKPIYQNGKAVESKAKITVNFSIKVGDSIPSNTLAQGTSFAPLNR